VYGEEFKSAALNVDWRNYTSALPDGMTVWFYPEGNPDRDEPYRFTTSSVRRYEMYLPGGNYQSAVIDYSPEEYSHQEFVGMDKAETACVKLLPAKYQADELPELYGEVAFHEPLPSVQPNGLYTIYDQAEEMALDSKSSLAIPIGKYGDYIPYEERDSYQSTLKITELESVPHQLMWQLRIRVFVKGIDYMWLTKGTLAGLADGHYLVSDKNTDVPCLLAIDDWEVQRTGINEGYISATVKSFGLRPSSIKSGAPVSTRADEEASDDIGHSVVSAPEELRLNLYFKLRDQSTELSYHFDLGEYIVSFDSQKVMRIDLREDAFGDGENKLQPIDLPYVDAYNGAGFNAEVEPWEDNGHIDVPI